MMNIDVEIKKMTKKAVKKDPFSEVRFGLIEILTEKY